jgi:branched-chain amino acid transport system substrate-binding protein
MGRARRLVGSCALLMAIALAVAACGGGGGGGTSGGGSVKIGVPGPLSGDYASAGTDIVNGAKLAAQDVNAKGGVLGKKIEIVTADDACDAQTAAQAAQKLLSSGVVAVAGGYCSAASLPELTAFHRRGLPFVMDASTNPKLTEMGFKEAFRDIGRDDQQGPFAAKFVAEFLKAKKVAVINDNTTYSKGLAVSAVDALKKAGVNVVFDQAITPGQQDYTPTLTKVISSNPDAVYYTGYFTEAGLLVKQARQLGYRNTFMGGDATNDPTLLKTGGPAANDMVITTAPLAQFLSGTESFVSAYEKQFGHGPGPYSVYEYDAVQVVAKAIQAAGSTDSAKLIDSLRSTRHSGLTGDISFDAKGDRAGVTYITITVRNEKFEAYKKLDDSGKWVDATAA